MLICDKKYLILILINCKKLIKDTHDVIIEK